MERRTISPVAALLGFSLHLAAQVSPPAIPVDCNVACPANVAGKMNTFKLTGVISSFSPPYVFPTSNQSTPAFAVQIGYTEVRATAPFQDSGDYIYRFTTWNTNNSGYACYNYNNLTFQDVFGTVLPTEVTIPYVITWDVHVNNLTDRVVLRVNLFAATVPNTTDHAIDIGPPAKQLVLPVNPTLADAKLDDPTVWPLPPDYHAVFGESRYYEGAPYTTGQYGSVDCSGHLTPVMSSSAPDPTNLTSIPVTVQFGVPVTGFSAASIVPGNAGVTGFTQTSSSLGTFTFNLIPINAGLVTADIAAGAAKDGSGNSSVAAAQFRRTFDNVKPTVTLNQAAAQLDPTNAGPIHFTAIFSEPVSGFSASCVQLSSTAGPVSAAVSPAGAGTAYDIAVSGMNQVGAVTASVSAGCAKDAAGNVNYSSTNTDNSVTFQTAPVVTALSVVFGPAGVYNLAGSTRNRLPWQITGIRVQFSGPVYSANANSLSGVAATSVSGIGTNTVTWAIAPLSQGQFSVSVAIPGMAAPFTRSFKVLWGDVDDNGVVDKSDKQSINQGQDLPYSIWNDLNGDGVIDHFDAAIAKDREGARLP